MRYSRYRNKCKRKTWAELLNAVCKKKKRLCCSGLQKHHNTKYMKIYSFDCLLMGYVPEYDNTFS